MALWSSKPKARTPRRASSSRPVAAISRNSGLKSATPPRPRISGLRTRGFAGAATNNMTYSLSSAPVSANQEIRASLKKLRARVRELGNNSPHMRMFYSLLDRNVVGQHGLIMRPVVQFGREKSKRDTADEQAIRDAWLEWGRVCDYRGESSIVELQKLILKTTAEDGEVLVQKIADKSNRFGFSLLLIDPERMPVDYNKDLTGGSFIRMGIEFDKYGRRLAYHFTVTRGSDDSYYGHGGRKFVRVPASQIIHHFMRERVEQDRGIPWASNTLRRMSMIDGYQEAAITAARTGAARNPVIETSEGAYEFMGNDIDDDGNAIIDAGLPGEILELPVGKTMSSYDPAYPMGEYPDFIKSMLRDVACGLTTSYNTLAGDQEGVNLSTMRYFGEMDRDLWKGLQGWIAERVMEPIRSEWMWHALFGGHIISNGTPLPFGSLDQYDKAKWRGRRWEPFDQAKDAKANTENLDNCLTSEMRIADGHGDDIEEIIREQAEVRDLKKKYKLIESEASNASGE